ncbi:MAG: polysaccharide biosynthesis tyrosine autokinase [Verrucomicrobia bacterium]|nr:polysaccharide biosynthesis tyrosine autokinase [Verrucomicrobiota bacterium]
MAGVTPPGPNSAAAKSQLDQLSELFRPQATFDYRHFFHFALAKSWVLILTLIAGLLVAISYVARTPKVYQSKLVLEVDAMQQQIVNVPDVRPQNLAALDQLRTIEQNLNNRTLMQRVVRALELTKNRDFMPPPEGGGSYSEEALASALAGMVNPIVRRGTRLIDVFVQHGDPKVAQNIANAVGREYIRGSIEKRSGTSEMALQFLMEEAERLKKKVRESEVALQEYREAEKSTSFEAQENIMADKLKDMNTKLSATKADRIRMEADFAQIRASEGNVEKLLTIPSIANHATVLDFRKQISEIEASIGTLSQRYKDKHPKMIALRTQLSEQNSNLRQAVLRLPPLIYTEYERIGQTERSFEAALAEQEKASLAHQKKTIRYKELMRDLETDRALFESVLRRMKETDVTKSIQADPVQVVELASYNGVPIRPDRSRAITTGLILGFMAGMAIILLLMYLDSSIKTVDQAEKIFGLPTLAAVPQVKDLARSTTLVVARDPNSVVAESFRSLRASLALLGPESERKITLFTSALPGEGKSFSCTNYSISLAQQNLRTLLIDADMRRPSLHKVFGMDRKAKGLTEYLVGTATLDESVQRTQVENLYVMMSGDKAPNPAELLSGNGFAELLTEAMKSFERIVVDTAPLVPVSDTLLLLPYVQTICMVVQGGKSPRNAVLRAIEMMAKVSHRPDGMVLNKMPRRSGIDYYYYYGEHGYHEGVYGSTKVSSKQPATAGKA